MKDIGTILCLLCISATLFASRVDTVRVYSESMKKEILVVYVLPNKALQGENCPVVYLLHGYSDNYKTWISRKPDLKLQTDEKASSWSVPMAVPAGIGTIL